MDKTGTRRSWEQRELTQLELPRRGLAYDALWDAVVVSGFAFVEEKLEAERAALCGLLCASAGAPSGTLRPCIEFAGVGRPAGESTAPAGTWRRGSRAELAELGGVERARSA